MKKIKNLIKKIISKINIINNIIESNKNKENKVDNSADTEKTSSETVIFPPPRKVSQKPDFSTTPLIFFIKNNVDKLLKENFEEFKKLNLKLKIGIEIEFYSINNIIDVNNFFDSVVDFTNKNSINLQNIERERGYNQFEIQLNPYENLIKLMEDYNLLKKFLLDTKNITFVAVPFYYEVGSALQINISLLDKNENNLFAKTGNNKEESNIFKNCVAGLLEKTNDFLPLYINSNNCLKRYDKDFAEIFYNKGKMPSPVFNCWGINNRTCSIRIPSPKNFNDFKNYESENKKNRRIEFRVPSSNSSIEYVLFAVTESMLYGMKHNLSPTDPTYDNVLKDNCDYEEIKYFTSKIDDD